MSLPLAVQGALDGAGFRVTVRDRKLTAGGSWRVKRNSARLVFGDDLLPQTDGDSIEVTLTDGVDGSRWTACLQPSDNSQHCQISGLRHWLLRRGAKDGDKLQIVRGAQGERFFLSLIAENVHGTLDPAASTPQERSGAAHSAAGNSLQEPAPPPSATQGHTTAGSAVAAASSGGAVQGGNQPPLNPLGDCNALGRQVRRSAAAAATAAAGGGVDGGWERPYSTSPRLPDANGPFSQVAPAALHAHVELDGHGGGHRSPRLDEAPCAGTEAGAGAVVDVDLDVKLERGIEDAAAREQQQGGHAEQQHSPGHELWAQHEQVQGQERQGQQQLQGEVQEASGFGCCLNGVLLLGGAAGAAPFQRNSMARRSGYRQAHADLPVVAC